MIDDFTPSAAAHPQWRIGLLLTAVAFLAAAAAIANAPRTGEVATTQVVRLDK